MGQRGFSMSMVALGAVVAILVQPGSATAAGGRTVRVSVSSAETQGDGDSYRASLSADARFVAFESVAGNLDPACPSGGAFVRDRPAGTTTCVSLDDSDRPVNGGEPSISGTGRFVAFTATNKKTGYYGVFVRDRSRGRTTLVSVDSNAAALPLDSASPAISRDGHVVAFVNVTPTSAQVYARDLVAGFTQLISSTRAGSQGDDASTQPAVSAEGRYVAFASYATDLISADTNGVPDVFVRDRTTRSTVRVSVTGTGGQANAGSTDPSLSADGSVVAFNSAARNLVPNDTNGQVDTFVRDRTARTTDRVSVTSSGEQADGPFSAGSMGTSVSPNGRFVAFASALTNLVPGDTNGAYDVFLHDRAAGSTTRVSGNSSEAQARGSSFRPSVAADTTGAPVVAFESDAPNLVPGDTNGAYDVFLRLR